MSSLTLQLLGEFEARDRAGKPITVSAKKSRALLAAIALAPAGSMSRDHLARLLWSDRADEQARASLRQALAGLRRELMACGAAPITTRDTRVKLDPLTEVDAITFRRLAASTEADDLRAAMLLYRAPLLADIEIGDAAFEEWLQLERRRLSDLAITALEKLWELERDGAGLIEVAARLLALDPLREDSHRKLILAYARAGERALALRQYETCRDMLKSEFDIEPSEETKALRDSLQDSRFESPSASVIPVSKEETVETNTRGRPSVAVLPFDVMADERTTLDAFADGLTEDVITGLSRIKALRVVARNTVFTFKGRPVDIRRLGRELDADYILEGSVRRLGERMRISMQLIEAPSGHHVWANRFDRANADLFELQDELTGSIVASVQTQIILHEGRAATGGGDETAAGLLARAWRQFLGLTEQSLARSRTLAERALVLEPDSGTAHRMLAVCHYHQIYMGFLPWTDAGLDEIFLHATRSIQAEDADEYSHWAMECAYLLRKEHAYALRSLQRALEINPNCSLARGSIGTVLAWWGLSDGAIKNNELALRMNPDDPSNFFRHLGLSLAHYLASRYDQAIFHVHIVRQLRPEWWLGLILHAASLAQAGQAKEATRILKDLTGIRPDVTCTSVRILPFAEARDREHLLDGLRRAGLAET